MGVAAHEARWIAEEFDGREPSLARAAARRRCDGEPLQYIVGHWPFRDLDLIVDERVLIPRPETEELVSVALDELARHAGAAPVVMDLGCGSGAIIVAIATELAARGIMATAIGVDVSIGALEVARANAARHHALSVSFVQSDWFANIDQSLEGRVDLVIANPPYVANSEMPGLDPVLGYEPRSALVAPDVDGVDGFGDVTTIIEGAVRWLSPTGVLIVEHGARHGEPARRAARDAGLVQSRTHRDAAGLDRALVASRS